jgi:DNA-binding winged helix-turn-helix (wHTH) protein/tetratricopeptide (TPR) repeat protein/TolB-like protein
MDRAISLEARRVELAFEPPFLLGRARIDPPAHEATMAGKATRLQPQNLKVLVALHDKCGQVVTRDELVDRCWDGRIVGEDVINRCISLLRRFAAKNGGFRIETVPRAGYRLIEASAPPPRKRSWTPAALAAVAATVALAALSVWLSLGRQPIRQGVPAAPVVTVVPFTVEDPNDPLERQVAEAAPISISHMLSQSGFPIVLADSPQAGAKSDFIISGSVRRSGASVDATVQLNGTRDGTMAFSHDFESTVGQSDNLPDQIGAVFAADLAWTGAEMVLDQRRPLDPQIASELMTAMSTTIEQGDNLRSYQIDRRLAPMAPNSAIVQLALAVDTGRSIGLIPRDQRAEAIATGRRAAQRARLLAPEFGDVYIIWCLLHSPVRRVECEARLRNALRIDPSSSFVPGALSAVLYDTGRIDEAVELARQSLANDPYKPAKMARMIRMLEASGNTAEAASALAEATRLWPGERMPQARILGMVEGGDYQGIARLASAKSKEIPDPALMSSLIAARERRDLPHARHDCGVRNLSPLTAMLCMAILADLGDFDGSYAIAASLYPASIAATPEEEDALWLDRPDGFPTAILTGPAGKTMRTDPRFMALASRTGLLRYWRSGRLPDFCTTAHEPVCGRIAARQR